MAVAHIDPLHEMQRLQTIQALEARERNIFGARDSAFATFLTRICGEISEDYQVSYQGANEELFAECLQAIHGFCGVNKIPREQPGCGVGVNIVNRSFSFEQGKKWSNQQRSKWIVPLCLTWLDALQNASRGLRGGGAGTQKLFNRMVAQLLMEKYSPETKKANAIWLICTQTLQTTTMRKKICSMTSFAIPPSVADIRKWIMSNNTERDPADPSKYLGLGIGPRNRIVMSNAVMFQPEGKGSAICGVCGGVDVDRESNRMCLEKEIIFLQEELAQRTRERDYYRAKVAQNESYIQQNLLRFYPSDNKIHVWWDVGVSGTRNMDTNIFPRLDINNAISMDPNSTVPPYCVNTDDDSDMLE